MLVNAMAIFHTHVTTSVNVAVRREHVARRATIKTLVAAVVRNREGEMTTIESNGSARAVIIGAGIVGNSLAYHLARLGWRDLILVDKGTDAKPGGSTGHASNFIFPVDYSKMMTELTADSTCNTKSWVSL